MEAGAALGRVVISLGWSSEGGKERPASLVEGGVSVSVGVVSVGESTVSAPVSIVPMPAAGSAESVVGVGVESVVDVGVEPVGVVGGAPGAADAPEDAPPPKAKSVPEARNEQHSEGRFHAR